MRNIQRFIMLAIVSVTGLFASAPNARAIDIDFDTYAAVAYSPATGKYGYGWKYGSRGAAERAALSMCKEPDAKIVGWVKGGWLVLAIGDDNSYGVAWEYGEGATNLDAIRRARAKLAEQTGNNKRPAVLICLCSGDVDPVVQK